MKKTRIVAFLLCLVMIVLCFGSCGMGKAAMEYKGRKLTANMYSYWMSKIKTAYVSAANDNDAYFDTAYNDSMTYEDKLMEEIDYNTKVFLVCLTLFEEFGLKVSDSAKESIELSMDDLVESYGSKEELNLALAPYDVDYNSLKEIMLIEQKANDVFDYIYGEGGPRAISDEKIDEYYKENYRLMDMMIIFTGVEYEKDSDGNPVIDSTTGSYKTKTLSAEDKAKKLTLVDDIMVKLDNGEDFDELKKKYNEDFNKDEFEYGYYMSPANDIDVYGADIAIAAQSLDINGVKKVEAENVVYILKRKELHEKPYLDEKYSVQFSNLVEYCRLVDFKEYMTELVKDVKVKEENISKYSVRTAPLLRI
ncbi:MAG: hypothetical protein IKL40_02675 [Clostridia bacterium]|nr:hypothetical protein [Clostridia bacterium]